MRRISSLALALGLMLALAAPASAYEAFKGFLGVLQNNPGATDGYILNCPYDSKVTYLMDKDGNVVNEWFSEYDGMYAELLPNGNMARHAKLPDIFPSMGGTCGILEEFDWEGNIVWSYQVFDRGVEASHHTFEVMPNGDYLILVWEHKTFEEAVAKGLDVTDPNRNLSVNPVRGFDGQPIDGIWPDSIRQVNHNSEIVWEWHVWDRTSGEDNYNGWNINKYLPKEQSLVEAGPDWTHFNGVAYNPRTNQITCTSRALGEVYVIDYATGDLVWRWGNPYNWGNGRMSEGYYDDGDQVLFGPHAPDWTIENNITVLHNGTNRPSIIHSGFYELAVGNDTPVFSWHSSDVAPSGSNYYSSHQSGIQKLFNGHYLLTLTTGGTVVEIAPDKSILWEFVNPVRRDKLFMTSAANGATGDTFHRSMFYAPDWVGFEGKDLSNVLYRVPNWVEALRVDPVPTGTPLP